MNIRRPAVAGAFYPANPKLLHGMVKGYIDDAPVEPAPDRVAAIITPHAGYIYSGATAGFAYKRVIGMKPARVILLGCSHHHSIEHASVYTSGSFETPLGNLPIGEAFAQELARATASYSIISHLDEHCLEVQLPFLQVALGEVPIVPVLFGVPARPWHVDVGRKIAALAEDSSLVIASTDLSHFLTEEKANAIDKRTLKVVLARGIDALLGGLRNETYAMCGEAAVVVAMSYALERGATEWSLLDYRTSAAVSGDYNRVVGYGAISMERSKPAGGPPES